MRLRLCSRLSGAEMRKTLESDSGRQMRFAQWAAPFHTNRHRALSLASCWRFRFVVALTPLLPIGMERFAITTPCVERLSLSPVALLS